MFNVRSWEPVLVIVSIVIMCDCCMLRALDLDICCCVFCTTYLCRTIQLPIRVRFEHLLSTTWFVPVLCAPILLLVVRSMAPSHHSRYSHTLSKTNKDMPGDAAPAHNEPRWQRNIRTPHICIYKCAKCTKPVHKHTNISIGKRTYVLYLTLATKRYASACDVRTTNAQTHRRVEPLITWARW